MLRTRLVSAFACLSTFALTACGAAVMTPSSSASSGDAQATPASGVASSRAPARSMGLTDSANDPKIVAAVKKVLACPWTDEDGFDQECAAYKEWSDNSDLLEVEDGGDVKKPGRTMLNLAEDKDEKVRTLALDKFPSHDDPLFQDKEAGERMIAGARAETSKGLKSSFGEIVGNIDLEKTGLLSEVTKLIDGSRSKELRGGVLRNALRAHPKSHAALELVLANAKNDDPEIRYEAYMGLPSGDFEAEECAELVKGLDDKSSDVVGLAAQQFGYMKCPGNIDVFLSFVKKRAAAGDMKDFLVPNALGNLCESGKISPAQKKEASTLAKSVASGKNDAMVRGNAIESAVACDPDGGRSFAQSFAKDPDGYVKSTVARALKQKKKK